MLALAESIAATSAASGQSPSQRRNLRARSTARILRSDVQVVCHGAVLHYPPD